MEFIINGKMPSLNDVINKTRLNKFAGATMKRNLQRDINTQLLHQMALKGITKPLDEACNIRFVFYEKNKKRDKDNIISSQKFLLDSMVDVGILKNDGWKWVNKLEYDFELDEEYKVIIQINEVGAYNNDN